MRFEGEIPSITNLATTAALTNFKNKIPNISDLVKKVDYNAKISEIENKYFNISDYNKFTSNTLDAKITQKKLKTLATKEQIKTATKTELKAEQDKTVNLQKYDLSLFIGQTYFNNGESKNYLVSQQFKKQLQLFLVFHAQFQNGNLRDC